jgi:DNA repair exonuclease SbcCD nuclease subunit
MKAALISDCHFGVRKGNDLFLNSQLKFFKEVFIPKLQDENITDIFILGDLMDNRNNINVKILSEVTKLFREDLKDFDIRILCGNHDIYYKTSVKTNSLAFLDVLPNVQVIEDITIDKAVLKKTGKKVLQVPWIVDEEDFKKRVANENIECDYCFGHFELLGFDLNRYVVSHGGQDPNIILDNYSRTYSGHFHKQSRKKQGDKYIQYLGCPLQLTRNDIGDEKGFFIVDFVNDTDEFVKNDVSMEFKRIKYPEKFTKKEIEGHIIDVHIDYDENYKEASVQKYLRILEKYNPALPPGVKIENKMLAGEIEEIEHQSIEDLLDEYINSLTINNKEHILETVINLYRQCNKE